MDDLPTPRVSESLRSFALDLGTIGFLLLTGSLASLLSLVADQSGVDPRLPSWAWLSIACAFSLAGSFAAYHRRDGHRVQEINALRREVKAVRAERRELRDEIDKLKLTSDVRLQLFRGDIDRLTPSHDSGSLADAENLVASLEALFRKHMTQRDAFIAIEMMNDAIGLRREVARQMFSADALGGIGVIKEARVWMQLYRNTVRAEQMRTD